MSLKLLLGGIFCYNITLVIFRFYKLQHHNLVIIKISNIIKSGIHIFCFCSTSIIFIIWMVPILFIINGIDKSAWIPKFSINCLTNSIFLTSSLIVIYSVSELFNTYSFYFLFFHIIETPMKYKIYFVTLLLLFLIDFYIVSEILTNF